MILETGPEDSHGGCGGDVFRKSVPDTSSGDRNSWSLAVNTRYI